MSRDEEVELLVVERLEEQGSGVELPTGPGRPLVKELWAGQAHEQDRGASGPLRDVLDEVQKGRLAPVHVVQDDDEWPISCQCFQELSDRPEALLASAGVGKPDELGDPGGDERGIVLVGEKCCDPAPRLPRCLLAVQRRRFSNDLCDGPKGDAVAIREAATPYRGRPSDQTTEEFRNEARLSNPSRA